MDEANPQGMERPRRIKTTHKGYSDTTYPAKRNVRTPGARGYAVGEGNNPQGMPRLGDVTMASSDPADFAPFKKGERFEGPKGAGNYTAF